MAKPKTNEQRLNALIKNNHPILNALLAERILLIADITEKDMQENPQEWNKNTIIHPDSVKALINNIREHLTIS